LLLFSGTVAIVGVIGGVEVAAIVVVISAVVDETVNGEETGRREDNITSFSSVKLVAL